MFRMVNVIAVGLALLSTVQLAFFSVSTLGSVLPCFVLSWLSVTLVLVLGVIHLFFGKGVRARPISPSGAVEDGNVDENEHVSQPTRNSKPETRNSFPMKPDRVRNGAP